jgi:hypothetical protein
MLPAVALWLLALSAVYLALRRSGIYGLVTDAQNLIAIFGVLHAAAYAIEAQQAIRRRGFTGLFRRGPATIPYKGETRTQLGPSGNPMKELAQ